MFNLVTDSCCDLSKELIAKFNVQVIPLSVFVGDTLYKDGIDIPNHKIYDIVENTGELPQTSAISTGEFIQAFSQLDGPILYIGISSQLSATVNNARIAAKEFPGRIIHVIDSRNLSTSIGHLVLKAAEYREQGIELETIVPLIEQLTHRLYCSFMIDQLDYLYLGGRCTALQSFFGSLLKIRPIIHVTEKGEMDVLENIRGGRHRGLDSMLKKMETNCNQLDLHRVFITHSGGKLVEKDAVYLEQEIHSRFGFENIDITTAGATITSHCGPNTIGILYTFTE